LTVVSQAQKRLILALWAFLNCCEQRCGLFWFEWWSKKVSI